MRNISVAALAAILVFSGCPQTQPAAAPTNSCELQAHTTDPSVDFCTVKDGTRCCNPVETGSAEKNRAQVTCDCDGDGDLDSASLNSDPLCAQFYATAPVDTDQCRFSPAGVVSNSSSGQVNTPPDAGPGLDRCDPRNGSIPADCPGQNGQGSSSGGGNATSANNATSSGTGATSASAAQNATSAAVGGTSASAAASTGGQSSSQNPCDPANGSVPPSCNTGSSSGGNAASSGAAASSSGGPVVCNILCNAGSHCVIQAGGVLACVPDAAGSSSSSAQSSSSQSSSTGAGPQVWQYAAMCGSAPEYGDWDVYNPDGFDAAGNVKGKFNLCQMLWAFNDQNPNNHCDPNGQIRFANTFSNQNAGRSQFDWTFTFAADLGPVVEQSPGRVMASLIFARVSQRRTVEGVLRCAAPGGFGDLHTAYDHGKDFLNVLSVQPFDARIIFDLVPPPGSQQPDAGVSQPPDAGVVNVPDAGTVGTQDAGTTGTQDAGTVTPTACIASGAPLCLDPDTVIHPGAVLVNPAVNANITYDVRAIGTLAGVMGALPNASDLTPTNAYGPTRLRLTFGGTGQSTFRMINLNGLYADIKPACDATQYTQQSGCYLPHGGAFPFFRTNTELVNGKFVTTLLGGIEPGAGQGTMVVNLSGFDAQGGPPCQVSTQPCRDALDVFGDGAHFPSNAWQNVPAGVTLIGYQVLYKDGCTADVYCQDPYITQNDGEIHLWATKDKLFLVVAIGSDGNMYFPSLSNWHIDPHPFYQQTYPAERLRYVTDPATAADYLSLH